MEDKLTRRARKRNKTKKFKIHNKGLANWYDNIVKKENLRMFCPVLSNHDPGDLVDCLKDKCGWWNDVYDSCSILQTAEALQALSRRTFA